MSNRILEVENLHVYYGMIQALKGISFHVDQGEIVTLIGANGAGKTTTLHTITGLIPSRSGKIMYNGKDITHTQGHILVSEGLAHVPEGRRVFASLTVYQNLMLGAYTRKDKGEIQDTLNMVYDRFPRLLERKNQMAGTLSGGEQQMHADGVTVLLVEQNANKALAIADRAYVLETGKITIEGKASDLANDPKVKAAYLT